MLLFKNQESGISVDADDANLWYCLEDKEGNIYTNVDSWKNGYTTAIAQKSPYPFAFAVDRTGGADKVRSYATRKNSPAVEAARSYLLNNQIADNYQKILLHWIRIWQQATISPSTVRSTASGFRKCSSFF